VKSVTVIEMIEDAATSFAELKGYSLEGKIFVRFSAGITAEVLIFYLAQIQQLTT
jgi:hypothetical protein